MSEFLPKLHAKLLRHDRTVNSRGKRSLATICENLYFLFKAATCLDPLAQNFAIVVLQGFWDEFGFKHLSSISSYLQGASNR